ncbi:MAG: UDP-glucose 4-epimerase GalE [Waddliaceae bacterium]|nr:UDP-glucose 4-epimerase GalE [Waddliaceae bacterium]
MTKKKCTILLTGGAGFVGSHVNKLLQMKGFDTIILDNLSIGNPIAVKHGTFIQGDVGCRQQLDLLFETYSIDAVMHFAASIDVGESMRKPELYYANNTANTINLLHAMIDHGVGNFVFSSTAAIYGVPEKLPVTEEAPHLPFTPYGRSKLMIEEILRDLDRVHGLKSCCFRYFNAAGGDPEGEIKNRKVRDSNLIPIILRDLKSPNPKGITVYGFDYPNKDGTCIRDYVHVWDIAQAHLSGLLQLLDGGDSAQYNLGNGQGFSILEVLDAVERELDLSLQVHKGDRRPGDPPILVADSQKAQKELNWKAEYPDLQKMIRDAWVALS